MRKLQQRVARFARGVRRRWVDWRTGTLVCYGGPMDGMRRPMFWAGHTVVAYPALQELKIYRGIGGYVGDVLGVYQQRDGLFRWEQYAPTRSEAPPARPDLPENWT